MRLDEEEHETFLVMFILQGGFYLMEAERKAELLANGTYRTYTMKRRKAFSLCPDELLSDDLFIDPKTGEANRTKKEEYFGMDAGTLEDCERIRKAKKNQRERIEEHLAYLFQRKDLEHVFLTFTFNDAALSLKKETRKQTIRRLLSKLCEDYILNVDYGKENEREHYHAIASFSKEDRMLEEVEGHLRVKGFEEYTLGFYDAEKVRIEDSSKERLARYVTKLVLHSVKVSQAYMSVKKGSDFQNFKKAKGRVKEQNHVSKTSYVGLEKALHPVAGRWLKRLKEEKTEPIQLDFIPKVWPLSS